MTTRHARSMRHSHPSNEGQFGPAIAKAAALLCCFTLAGLFTSLPAHSQSASLQLRQQHSGWVQFSGRLHPDRFRERSE
jgi:hypothetical protein